MEIRRSIFIARQRAALETEAEIEITVGAFGGTTAVRLQNFADLNGNGAIEAGEPLVRPPGRQLCAAGEGGRWFFR